MNILEFIARKEFDYILSFGFPIPKSIIMSSFKIDEQTYQKEIRKLKKEGLIQSTYVRYEEDNISLGMVYYGKSKRITKYQKD